LFLDSSHSFGGCTEVAILFRLPPTVLEVLRATVLVGVVLVRTLVVDVVLIVHLLSVLLRLALGLLLVEPVLALGLGELVDLSSCEASQQLLCELVRYGLA
jgi:hypothetical protein